MRRCREEGPPRAAQADALETATDLCERFVWADAPSQVNLPQRIVSDVRAALDRGDLEGLLDDAVTEARTLVSNRVDTLRVSLAHLSREALLRSLSSLQGLHPQKRG